MARIEGTGGNGTAPAGWGLLAAIAVVVCVVMQPYYFGYRLSGDDIWFLTLAIEGWDSVRADAIAVARDQGRVGQLLMVPLNAAGAFLAGDPLWRVAILAAYVLQLLLFAVLVARLVRREVHPFLFLLLVVLHPLAFAFMPPNAYPLQNTVPFIVILVARLVLLDERRRGAPVGLRTAAAQSAFVVGMFVSEFAIAFGTALLAAEYLARMQWTREDGNSSWGGMIRRAFSPHLLVADGLAVLCVVVPYAVFRLAYPGNYEGNTAGGLFEPARIAITAFGHIRDGTAFPRLGGGFSSASVVDLALAAAVGVAVAAILYRAAGPVLRMGAPLASIIVALMLAVYVSLPIAVSTKYQQACVDRGACAYIDSRMSYLLVMVAVMAAVAVAWRAGTTEKARRRVLAGACAILGIMAAMLSVYNAGKAREMRLVHAVWQRADALACFDPALAADEAALLAAIDPRGFVVVNQPNRAVEFWKVYVAWRAGRDCR